MSVPTVLPQALSSRRLHPPNPSLPPATPLEQLPAIVAAVGDRAEVYSTAESCSAGTSSPRSARGPGRLVGRAYLYGLMAGGERGVDRAGDILRRDTIRTMQLLGVTEVAGLTPDRVRIRDRD